MNKNNFSKKDIHVTNKYMEKSSTLLIIREMRVKNHEIPSHASQNVDY